MMAERLRVMKYWEDRVIRKVDEDPHLARLLQRPRVIVLQLGEAGLFQHLRAFDDGCKLQVAKGSLTRLTMIRRHGAIEELYKALRCWQTALDGDRRHRSTINPNFFV